MSKMSFYFLIIFSMFLFLISLYFMYYDMVYFLEWEVISVNSLFIEMTILLDWMSLMFMSFVLLISSLVIFYSHEYMGEDKFINRFILLVIMFVFSMMLLIISPNLISILLGWDGLGLISYCLVIYFQNIKSFNAGMLTVLSNRVGDVGILLAIAWMLNYGSWNYIFMLEFNSDYMEMKYVGILILIAAMTKSAQIPFSSWLPAAMAAPTPVSALVHSSTLVTAGVYLLIRFNVLLGDSILGQSLLLISGLTMFMAGMGANFEFDLKKIIALSTLSQLGLMMSILSMGYYKLAFFHLLTHALFKALLFMCAGAIIHNMSNNQDIRLMGSLSIFMPFTSSCFNVANLALCGMPFLAGFYSKDLILEVVSMSSINLFSYFLYFFSTGLTVSYSFRLVYYTMCGNLNFNPMNMLNDESWIMLRGMLGLLIMSLMMGSVLNWLMFDTPIVIVLPWYMKFFTLFVCLCGGLIGYFLAKVSLFSLNKSLKMYFLINFFGSMWFMPMISTYGIIKLPMNLGKNFFKLFDSGWSEFLGGQNLYKFLVGSSLSYNLIQNNNLKVYLLIFIFWVLILISLLSMF
uniref:NADH-ubiquinone oxidoreductase chain 5 n=1 Tax=Chamaemyia juncorum TaxID=1979291 RepID=A0A1W5YKC2_9MUSC|nr:NADH dehydrogenase subunit 5 [Chamaemyia juncorum]